MNIGSLISRHALYRPNHTAVVFEDERLSYREFNERVNRLANALLDLGVRKGDKVATILPNCLELLECYWAVAKIGAVIVPLSQLLRGKGLTTLLNDSGSTTLITDAHFSAEIDAIRPQLPLIPADRCISTGPTAGYQNYRTLTETASGDEPSEVEIDNEDAYNIIYSSGTTGLPKGIVHTHFVRSMYCTIFSSAFRMTPESVVIHAGSIVFNGAFVMMMPAFFLGATFVLMKQFDPESFLAACERERATHSMMVPSQIVALLHSPMFSAESLRSIEAICTVGAPLHLEHKENLTRKLPGIFYELYGLTEGFVTILDKYDYSAKPGSVGVPPPFFELRIVGDCGKDAKTGEVGEIVGRGPIMMPGYYKRTLLTDGAVIDGWLYTGDLGYMDEEGFLFLVDRKKDLIISGGVNVFPKDIEEIVVQHPAVQEAAVFGIPSKKWGETPLAAVILKHRSTIVPEALCEWINERVEGKHQRVCKVVLMDEFPRSTAGKTLKREMREPYWAGLDVRI